MRYTIDISMIGNRWHYLMMDSDVGAGNGIIACGRHDCHEHCIDSVSSALRREIKAILAAPARPRAPAPESPPASPQAPHPQ